MVIKNEEKQPIVLLTLEDVLEQIENKCGVDVRNFIQEHIEMLEGEIEEQKGTIDSLEEELNIIYEKEDSEDK